MNHLEITLANRKRLKQLEEFVLKQFNKSIVLNNQIREIQDKGKSYDQVVLLTRLGIAEQNITKLKKLTTEQHNAIQSLINLTVKQTRHIKILSSRIIKIKTGVSV